MGDFEGFCDAMQVSGHLPSRLASHSNPHQERDRARVTLVTLFFQTLKIPYTSDLLQRFYIPFQRSVSRLVDLRDAAMESCTVPLTMPQPGITPSHTEPSTTPVTGVADDLDRRDVTFDTFSGLLQMVLRLPPARILPSPSGSFILLTSNSPSMS